MPWDPELEKAIKTDDILQIKSLMDKGADPNVTRAFDQNTLLGYAIKHKPAQVIKAIVEHDKFKYVVDTGIALVVAIYYGHPEYLPHILKKRNPDDPSVDLWDIKGKTALWLAEENEYTEAAALLKAHGAIPRPRMISEDELEITRMKLGSGGYATVKKGKWNGKIVAVKQSDEESHGYKEARFISLLSHPNIVALHGAIETLWGMNLVLEYMDNGNLREYLEEHPRKEITDYSTVFQIFSEITQAVAYLHENRIIHLDLRGPNILLNRQLTPKICDFGVSVKLPQNSESYEYKDTNNIRTLTRAYDILWLGIILHMVATQDWFTEFPAHVVPVDKSNLLLDTAGDHLHDEPINAPTKILNLIQWCTTKEPSKRPTAEEVIKELKAAI